ncbi:MAG: ABC transporter permease [Armatimonadetes bacterium]|jgi:phospholipid/cholesterol/gamma-HCH transport system permease protein|nr:ABC transporter permease [Armatimonadota bacterium]
MKTEAAEVFEEVGETATKLVRRTIVRAFEYLGELMTLLGRTLRAIFQEGIHLGDLAKQLTSVGTESLPIVLLTVGFSGAVLALYTVGSLTNLGIGNLLGGIVALSIVRETGPLITAVTLIARVGSGITAEIGAMKTTEQVDALRAMGISPVAYLVVPRLIACLIMGPVTTLFGDAAGLFGGGLIAVNQGQTSHQFIDSFRQLLDTNGSDILEGLFKALVFGMLIALIACREGLETKGGAAGVGRSTNRAVVFTIILVFAADFVMTWFFKAKSVV